ncbi:hypothetical protein ADUPG1_002168, partial [Aduncisulcus paluster]
MPIHISGKSNGAADALSRLIKTFSPTVYALRRKFDHDNSFLRLIREAQSRVSIPESIKDKGKQNEDGVWEDEDGMIYVPEDADLHLQLIKEAHASFIGGHKGINATLRQLKKWKIAWRGIRKEISTFIKACLICQRERLTFDTLSSQGSTFVDKPFHLIAVDTIGPFSLSGKGNLYCLSVIDCFTRFIVLIPTKTVKAEEAADAMMDYF